jgi:DNA-directed RNA polymerase beta' subunit
MALTYSGMDKAFTSCFIKLERCLINALEDVKVENDGSVRHSGGQD